MSRTAHGRPADAPLLPSCDVLEIGLTGGIGAGKSTVSAALARRGAVVIDADAIVREVQAPGTPVVAAMVDRFGEGILDPDGALDRAAVAAIVFADQEALSALNAIVHPAVVEEMTRRREAHADTDAIVILDVPLLVESRYEGLGGIVVVDVDPELAVARLVANRGFTEEDARARMARQAGREERLAAADFVIDNSGTPEELEVRIDECWSWMAALPRPPAGSPLRPIRGRTG
jgi:dephospho-CoA kinase